jgi:hypothetical protein
MLASVHAGERRVAGRRCGAPTRRYAWRPAGPREKEAVARLSSAELIGMRTRVGIRGGPASRSPGGEVGHWPTTAWRDRPNPRSASPRSGRRTLARQRRRRGRAPAPLNRCGGLQDPARRGEARCDGGARKASARRRRPRGVVVFLVLAMLHRPLSSSLPPLSAQCLAAPLLSSLPWHAEETAIHGGAAVCRSARPGVPWIWRSRYANGTSRAVPRCGVKNGK